MFAELRVNQVEVGYAISVNLSYLIPKELSIDTCLGVFIIL